MGHDSNWAGNQGRLNPQRTQEQFKSGGMSDSQAAEAARAAERQRQGK